MSARRILICFLLVLTLCCTVQATDLVIAVTDTADDAPLADAAIYVDGDYTGKTDVTGKFTYSHAKTVSFYLKVTKAGYDDWTDLVGNLDTAIALELSQTAGVLAVQVYDAETVLPVQDALVKISGESTAVSKRTDSAGAAEFSLLTGRTYSVEIRAQNYDPLYKTVIMGGGKVVQYWLHRSDTIAVRVLDTETREALSGADVYIDSGYAGITDENGFLVLHLQREKTSEFMVEKQGYRTYSAERYISAEDAVVTVLLPKVTCYVAVSVFDESLMPVQDADIHLNGAWIGKTNQYGRYSLGDLAAGVYLVGVTADGFAPWSQECDISQNAGDIIAELEYLRANVTVVVEGDDGTAIPGAEVFVDGASAGVTGDDGHLSVLLKTNSAYNITAASEGYEPASMEVKIPADAGSSVVTLVLKRSFDATTLQLVAGVIVAAGVIYTAVTWVRRRRSRPPGGSLI